MEAIFKSFTTHKRGEEDEDIQDSICINVKNGRFALSDGVSQSFLPRLLADILTETYVSACDRNKFPNVDLAQTFQLRKDTYISLLDEFGVAMQEIAEETFKKGAATFVGLEIGERLVSWKVIGDSCLFIVPDQGNIQCICSEKVHVDEKGKVHVSFGRTPAQIQSDGKICGNIISGSAKREVGWYILMSDTISDWFIQRYNNGDNVIQHLFQLEGNENFENYIEEEFKNQRIGNDDCSVILIRVDNEEVNLNMDNDKPNSDYFNNRDIDEKEISDSSKNNNLFCLRDMFSNLLKKIRLKKSNHNNNDCDELHNFN